MSILEHPQVVQILFHPRPESPFASNLSGIAVSIAVEPTVSIGGRLYPHEPTSPLILFFHGNGEIAADYDDIAHYYQQMGISLLVMDYRGYGRSGGEPTGMNLVTDSMLVFNALPNLLNHYGFTPRKLYVMGRSLGSVPALEIASQTRTFNGLIIESGFANSFKLLYWLGLAIEGASEATEGFRNGLKMRQVSVPTLIIHGENDLLIPVSEGKELYQNCTADTKRLVLIPHAGHNDLMVLGMRHYFRAIQEFVQETT